MGEVFRARDTRLDRTVAIKVSQRRFTGRFKREAKAVAALNHPNIVQIFETGVGRKRRLHRHGVRARPDDDAGAS